MLFLLFCCLSLADVTPFGSAGGSLNGNYPSPSLAATGVTAGTYSGATVTVATDGRIISSGTPGGPPTLAGTLTVAANTAFFARIQPSSLSCSDLRVSAIINALSL